MRAIGIDAGAGARAWRESEGALSTLEGPAPKLGDDGPFSEWPGTEAWCQGNPGYSLKVHVTPHPAPPAASAGPVPVSLGS